MIICRSRTLHKRGSLALSLLASIFGPAVAAPGYTFVDLGALGGSQNQSYGWGINNSNQVVGYSTTAFGQEAFEWSNGQMVQLSAPGGGDYQATGIDDQGTIIGLWNGGALEWNNGSVSNLGGAFGYFNEASIGNGGVIFAEPATYGYEGDLAQYVNGAWVDQGRPFGNPTYIDHTVSSNGFIGGEASDFSGSVNYGWIFSDGTGFVNVTNPNHYGTVVAAVNSSLEAVGAWNDGGPATAFEWQNGLFTALPSTGTAVARAINDSGLIVGNDGSDLVEWLNGSEIDLQSYLSAQGFYWSGDMFVNDNGWILSSGYDSSGVQQAFLLEPSSTAVPAPGAALTACLWALALRRNRSRRRSRM